MCMHACVSLHLLNDALNGRVAEGQSGLPGRPAKPDIFSLAWQAGPWPDRPAGRDPPTYYNKLFIHFAMSIAIYSNNSYFNQLVMVTIYKLQIQKHAVMQTARLLSK